MWSFTLSKTLLQNQTLAFFLNIRCNLGKLYHIKDWWSYSMCHALVLVFCVFFIYLVRPGCDMGLFCGVFLYWGLVGIGIVVE